MAKVTGLILLCFTLHALSREVPAVFLHGLTSVYHSPLLAGKSIDLAVAHNGFFL